MIFSLPESYCPVRTRYRIIVRGRIAYNVWWPCAGRLSQTFVANQTKVHREDKDFEANAPLRQNGEADH
jgi:hypothetical protein